MPPTLRSKAPKRGLGCYELEEDEEQETKRLLEESDWEELPKSKKIRTVSKNRTKSELVTNVPVTKMVPLSEKKSSLTVTTENTVPYQERRSPLTSTGLGTHVAHPDVDSDLSDEVESELDECSSGGSCSELFEDELGEAASRVEADYGPGILAAKASSSDSAEVKLFRERLQFIVEALYAEAKKYTSTCKFYSPEDAAMSRRCWKFLQATATQRFVAMIYSTIRPVTRSVLGATSSCSLDDLRPLTLAGAEDEHHHRAGVYALLLLRNNGLSAVYVGSTSTTFRKRLIVHESSIRRVREYLDAGATDDEIKKKMVVQAIHFDAARPGVEVCAIILAVTPPGKTGSDFLELLETTLVLLLGTYRMAYTSDEDLAVRLAQKARPVNLPKTLYKGLNRALPCAPNLFHTAAARNKVKSKRRKLFEARLSGYWTTLRPNSRSGYHIGYSTTSVW